MSGDFVQFPAPSPMESLYLVGFRLDPSHDGPEFYTLFALEGENERPLVSDGRIVFFGEPRQAVAALKLADDDMKKLGPAPRELEMMIDIADALYTINSQDLDADGTLMECLSCMDDLVRAAKLNIPAEYMGVLAALSERLLEQQEFGSWLKQQGIDRERVEDALIWCVGAVTVKSTRI